MGLKIVSNNTQFVGKLKIETPTPTYSGKKSSNASDSINPYTSTGPGSGGIGLTDTEIIAARAPVQTFVGLTWETLNSADSATFSITDDSTLNVTSIVNPTNLYGSGFLSSAVSGDFTFQVNFTYPYNGGLFSLMVANSSGSPLFTTGNGAFMIQTAGYSYDYNGFSRVAYPSYNTNTTALSSPTYMKLIRSSGQITGVGEHLSSGAFSYSNDVHFLITYGKITSIGNSSTPFSFNMTDCTLI